MTDAFCTQSLTSVGDLCYIVYMKETNKARSAFEEYYNMGPGRSIHKLHALYQTQPETRPTRHISTLKSWSTNHGWQKRVQQRDLEIAEVALEGIKELATRTGYAVFQKRIYDLGKLAEKIFEGLSIAKPQNYLPAIKEFRGLLGDIAAEMGERESKHKVTVEDWRSEVVQLLIDGRITQEDIIDDFGNDLATELFVAAGISVGEAREAEAESAEDPTVA